MKHTKLNNLTKLPNKVKIYVPSTMNANEQFNPEIHINETLEILSNMFGGSTSTEGTGTWVSEKHGLIKEKITVCESFCDESKLTECIDSVVEYCLKLKKDMGQENISLEVNNELYFV